MNDSSSHAKIEGPRQARPTDRGAILTTANRVMRIEANRPPTIARDWSYVYDLANIENVIIMTAGEQVASMVGVWPNDIELGPVKLRVGGINCMATLPEFRKGHLGSRVMQAAHRHMQALGCQVGLLGTNIANWYRRLGWERAGCARFYHFDRANIPLLPALPGDVQLHSAGEEAIDEVIHLHHADYLGGIRTPDVFRQLLKARTNRPIIFARRGDKTLAYLLARNRTVVEWGGPAVTVAGLVRAWFESIDDSDTSTSGRDASRQPVLNDQITVVAPHAGHGFVQLLDELGIPCRVDYLGMLYLIDPRGVLDAFDYKEIRLSSKDGMFTVARGGEEVTLAQTELTKLFFGPERVTDLAGDVFPLPFWQWQVERV